MRDLEHSINFLDAKIEQKEEMLHFQFNLIKSVYSPRNLVNNFIDDLSDTFPMVDIAIKGYQIASSIIEQLRK